MGAYIIVYVLSRYLTNLEMICNFQCYSITLCSNKTCAHALSGLIFFESRYCVGHDSCLKMKIQPFSYDKAREDDCCLQPSQKHELCRVLFLPSGIFHFLFEKIIKALSRLGFWLKCWYFYLKTRAVSGMRT